IGQQRTDDVPGSIGKAAPVRAELERHDNPRYHAHAERDGEDPDPEIGDPEIDLAPGREMQPLEHCDIGGSTHRERGEQDMPCDNPGELYARQNEEIWPHRSPPISEILLGRRRCRERLRVQFIALSPPRAATLRASE